MAASNKIQVGYIEAQDGAQFEIDAGTAAAPGLVFDDSAATGLYSPGTGQIAWSTSGKQTALRILADGKVGVDCSPTVAFEVNGTIKASAIDAPIEGTLDDWIVHAGDTNTKIGFSANDTFQVHTGGSARLTVTDSASTFSNIIDTTVIRRQVQNGSVIIAGGNATNDGANIAMYGSAHSSQAGNFEFRSSGSYVVKIKSDGKVGIGTVDPTSLLHLKGSAPRITLTDTAGSEDYAKIFSSGGALYLQQRDDSAHGNIVFRTEDNSGASEKVRIRSTGQVEFKNGSFSDNVNCVMASGSNLEIGATATIKLRTATNERLRVDAAGSVHVGFSGESLYFQNGFNNSNARIQNAGASNNSNIRFLTRSSGTEGERVRIGSDGNVNFGANKTVSMPSGTGIQVYHSANPRIKLVNDTTGNTSTDGFQLYLSGSGVIFDHKENAEMRFYTNALERLRIDANGDVGIGIFPPVPQDSGAKTLHIHHPDTSGSVARAGLRLTTGISGSAVSNGGFLGLDYSNNLYLYNQENGTLRIGTNAAEKVRLHSNGTYFYGQDNVFYGATSGNANGELHIRSIGTAVYQHLRFKSSDGSSQSQIMGYGGGSILFHYSNEFVWAINNQGERLNLTNTSLKPRSSSTVLDLGTTGDRYRRTYTDGITVNTSNTNTNFCINGGSAAHVMTIRNTTGGNGNVGMLFSTQDHSGGREKAAIYHQETHGQAHYGGDFIFCLANSTGGAAQVGPSDERFRIKRSGFVEMTGASDVRFTLGSSGTAGTNDSNWIRGEGANIMYNAASANHIWETGGAKQMEISAGNLFLRSSGTTRYIVLGSAGDSTAGGANNSMNWIRSNNTNVQYNNAGGFHGWEVSGAEKFRINSNGSASLTGSLSQNTSDDRLKKDKVEILNALDKVNSLSSFTHKWNDIAVRAGLEENKEEVGLSAQEVQSIHPSLVDINITIKDPEDPTTEYLTIHYHKVVPLLVAAIKELSAEVAALKSSINN